MGPTRDTPAGEGRARDRALELVELARTAWAEAGEGFTDPLEVADAWLSQRGELPAVE